MEKEKSIDQPRKRARLGVFVSSLLACLLFVPLLASCGGPTALQLVPVDLGIPAQALNSPVVGPLPDATELHVLLAVRINGAAAAATASSTRDQAGSRQVA